MPEYLLPLSVLHAAAPGILDVVFGKDGSHAGSADWSGPIMVQGQPVHHHVLRVCGGSVYTLTWKGPDLTLDMDACALDLLLPSTACRLAGLCLRAGADHNALNADLCWEIIAEAMDNRIHPETAARMVALTLRLAPKIAALKVHQ